MRLPILFVFLFSFFIVKAQNGYNCFYNNAKTANWQYLGPTNGPDELDDQRFGNICCFSINPKDSSEIFIGSPTGSLLHTTNRGKSWQSLTDNCDLPIIGVNDIIIDYSKKPYHILIATGSANDWYHSANLGFFKSTDGGKSWLRSDETLNDDIFSPAFLEFIEHGDTIFARGYTEIVYSTDAGKTFHPIVKRELLISGLPLKERELRYFFYEETEDKIYFSTKQKYNSRGNEDARIFTISLKTRKVEEITPLLLASYKTEKKGNGFEAIQILKQKKGQLLLVASHYNSQELYFYDYDIKNKKITNYEVPNAGRMGVTLYWLAGVKLNEVNDKIRYIADVYLYKSIDGGQSYKRLFDYGFGDNSVPHVDIRSIQISKHSADGESDHIYLGTDGGLSFSTDGGKSFINLNGAECQLTQFYGLGSSPFNGMISAGAQDNSIMTLTPDTKKWSHKVRGDGYDVAYSQTKPGLAYGQYNVRALYKTVNDSVPFWKSMRLAPQNESSNRKTLLAHSNGDLYFAAQSFFHLPKGQTKWTEYKTPQTHKALAFDVSKTNPNIIYTSGNWNGLYKSEDGGKTWKDIQNQIIIDEIKQDARIQSICISPYDPERIWIGLGYMGSYTSLCDQGAKRVLESRDGGKTWQNISSGLPVFAVQDLIFYEGSYDALFAATDQGIYYRRGTGHTWQRFSDKLPKSLIGELEINYCSGKLIAATYGRGLWETDLPAIEDKNPLILRGLNNFTAAEGEALVINQDITLRGRSKLTIDCPVYMPKDSKIKVRNKNQVIFVGKGRLLNGCGDLWQGIVEK